MSRTVPLRHDGGLAVVLFSHGSLLCGAGELLAKHAARLRASGHFAAVEVGFLNYSQPPVEQAIAQCRAAGARKIVIVPYFLVAGRFVRRDLPERLVPVIAQNSNVDIVVARAMEDHPLMEELVTESLKNPRDPEVWRADAILQARRQCELRENCPLYGSEMCRAGAHDGDLAEGGFLEKPCEAPMIASGRRGLLLVLHGSPRPEANEPALEIARSLRGSGEFGRVEVAYLECNEPDVADAIADLAGWGVERLDVVPYFLHAGKHLVLDIGGALVAAQRKFLRVQIQVYPAIGELASTNSVLLERALEAGEC